MEDGRKIFEDMLEEHIRINTEGGILPPETAICRRLLARTTELVEAYDELWAKVGHNRFSLCVFIDGLLGVAAVWNPAKMAEARRMRDRLREVNEKIAGVAFELAELLHERSTLHDHSGFVSETHYHILGPFDEAARGNYRFESYVQKELKALRGQFDFKYWPTLSDFVRVLGVDAGKAVTHAHDSLTAAGTASSRPSRADFFRAWFELIEENCEDHHLPRDFRLTDASYASLANCALDLGPEELVASDYVKRLRQRNREADRSDPN